MGWGSSQGRLHVLEHSILGGDATVSHAFRLDLYFIIGSTTINYGYGEGHTLTTAWMGRMMMVNLHSTQRTTLKDEWIGLGGVHRNQNWVRNPTTINNSAEDVLGTEWRVLNETVRITL